MRCFHPPPPPRRSAVLWKTAPGEEVVAQNRRIRTKILNAYRRQTVESFGVNQDFSRFFIHSETLTPGLSSLGRSRLRTHVKKAVFQRSGCVSGRCFHTLMGLCSSALGSADGSVCVWRDAGRFRIHLGSCCTFLKGSVLSRFPSNELINRPSSDERCHRASLASSHSCHSRKI